MNKLLILRVAIGLFFIAGCQGIGERQVAAPAVKQMSVNGVSLSYLEQGKGAPLLFVHGSNADHRLWEPQREAFANNYRFIAIDQRYFGAAPWPDNGEKFSLETQTNDLAEFIRGLNAGPVNLVGWSLSGGSLLAVAVRHPELVKSLFIYEPALNTFVTDPADAKAVGDDRKAMAGPALVAAKAGNTPEAVKIFMDSVNAQPGSFDALSSAAKTVMLDNARMLPLLFAAPPPPQITCAQLGRIKAPVQIVRGELTRPFYKIIADTASRCITGSKLVVVPNARHLWPGQDPSAFNELLLSFLKSN
ncbi:MAG: alpha/beta hydrolase [Pseudomonadota bacterium]|nr:alpha/beta hydrolase [Pseudomonadota bacterium]